MQQKNFIICVLGVMIILFLSTSVIAAYGNSTYGNGTYVGEESVPPSDDDDDGGSGSGGGGGGGGGGYSGNAASNTNTVVAVSMDAGIAELFTVDDVDVPVADIVIVSNTQLSNVELRISSFDTKPMLVSSPPKKYSKVYKYLDITKKNINDVQIIGASLTVVVSKTWLSEQGLLEQNIVVIRLKDGVWTELPTRVVRSDAESITLNAETPGFSYFAIVTRPYLDSEVPIQNNVVDNTPIITTPSNNVVQDVNVPQENLGVTGSDSLNDSGDEYNRPLFTILTILTAGVLLVISFMSILFIRRALLYRKLLHKDNFQPLNKELSPEQKLQVQQYVDKARKLRMSDELIAQKLRKARLNEAQIKSFNIDTAQ